MQSDPHLLGVLGYVEANPLRARMVARAEEWRWSSLGQGTVRQAHDCAGVDGKRLQLTEWPPRPAGRMVERVNAMVANEELERLRSCIRRSRPFGGGCKGDAIRSPAGLANLRSGPAGEASAPASRRAPFSQPKWLRRKRFHAAATVAKLPAPPASPHANASPLVPHRASMPIFFLHQAAIRPTLATHKHKGMRSDPLCKRFAGLE